MSKAKKTAGSAAVYVVERVAFRAYDYRGLIYAGCGGDEGESTTPVRAFTDRAAAEACCETLDAEAKASLPPALFASYDTPKHLPDRIAALGLPKLLAPKNDYELCNKFHAWWSKHGPGLTPEQVAAIWEVFDHIKLFRVVRKKLEE